MREIICKVKTNPCYIERFNECGEQLARILDAWFGGRTDDMTLINELIEKHIEKKNKEERRTRI